MFPALLQYIEKGNSSAVQRIINEGSIDIDQIHTEQGDSHNALSMCVKFNRMEIYQFLLKMGAKVKLETPLVIRNCSYPSLYSLVERYNVSNKFARLLIKDSDSINPIIMNGGVGKTLLSLLDSHDNNRSDYIKQLVSLILHEAIIRGDESALDFIISIFTSVLAKLSTSSITTYIGNPDIRYSKEAIQKMNEVLDKIPHNKVDAGIILDIKKLLDERRQVNHDDELITSEESRQVPMPMSDTYPLLLIIHQQIEALNTKINQLCEKVEKVESSLDEQLELGEKTLALQMEDQQASLEGKVSELEEKMDKILKHLTLKKEKEYASLEEKVSKLTTKVDRIFRSLSALGEMDTSRVVTANTKFFPAT